MEKPLLAIMLLVIVACVLVAKIKIFNLKREIVEYQLRLDNFFNSPQLYISERLKKYLKMGGSEDKFMTILSERIVRDLRKSVFVEAGVVHVFEKYLLYIPENGLRTLSIYICKKLTDKDKENITARFLDWVNFVNTSEQMDFKDVEHAKKRYYDILESDLFAESGITYSLSGKIFTR